jgi:hypothetical protein
MKIAAGFVIAASALDINRKVPPRHPENRLARLQSFCTSLAEADWIVPGKSHRFVKMSDKCVSWADKRSANFQKCGSYDPDLPNGGPDPSYVPQEPRAYVSNWDTGRINFDDMFSNDRKRRSDGCADWDGNTDDLKYFEWTDMIEGDTLTVQVKEPCAPGYIHPDWIGDDYLNFVKDEMISDCLEDCEDSANQSQCEAKCAAVTPRGKGGSRIKRTNTRGPFKTAKSIVSGIRKWEERYLAKCHGHRSGRHMNKRHNFMRMVLRKFTSEFCSHEDCLEDGFAQKFKWGGKNLKTTV